TAAPDGACVAVGGWPYAGTMLTGSTSDDARSWAATRNRATTPAATTTMRRIEIGGLRTNGHGNGGVARLVGSLDGDGVMAGGQVPELDGLHGSRRCRVVVDLHLVAVEHDAERCRLAAGPVAA